jgi:8-hydroxy-5-deazaflavin:NADPH oxidoreductase
VKNVEGRPSLFVKLVEYANANGLSESKRENGMSKNCRLFFRLALAFAVSIAMSGLFLRMRAANGAEKASLKIGIIGSGNIGGTLGEFWIKAGHEVLFSSRHPAELKGLVERLGPRAHGGTTREAVNFGDVILVSVPYAALPEIGRDLVDVLPGKIVLDTCNPVPNRDGKMAEEARAKGTGIASPEYLRGVRLVRAFNTLGVSRLRSAAFKAGERIAIPIAGDDKAALEIAFRLVKDAGFDPVLVGPLVRAKEFDQGGPLYGKVITAREMQQSLSVNPTSEP